MRTVLTMKCRVGSEAVPRQDLPQHHEVKQEDPVKQLQGQLEKVSWGIERVTQH